MPVDPISKKKRRNPPCCSSSTRLYQWTCRRSISTRRKTVANHRRCRASVSMQTPSTRILAHYSSHCRQTRRNRKSQRSIWTATLWNTPSNGHPTQIQSVGMAHPAPNFCAKNSQKRFCFPLSKTQFYYRIFQTVLYLEIYLGFVFQTIFQTVFNQMIGFRMAFRQILQRLFL